jgi:hypothetical protein
MDRPNGFPDSVTLSIVLAGEDREAINPSINRIGTMFLTQHALIAFKSPLEFVEAEMDLEKRYIVPLSTISYIETKVYPVTGDTPVLNENGMLVTWDRDGKEIEVKIN